ncbi:MAG: FISUMP domain-containing protein [bacterium]
MKIKIFSLCTLIIVLTIVLGCKKNNPTESDKQPTLSTVTITEITQTTAVAGGNIISDGGSMVTSKGVCWSTNLTPTITDNKTVDGNGVGAFSSILTGLTANTTYYVRAYAINNVGTGYGNTVSFITLSNVIPPESLVTDYDGNRYKTVKIGNQIWMAENLRSIHYSDGTPIPYYIYNNDNANLLIYGRLYSSSAVLKGAASSNTNPSNVQGIAPNGWHLPSKAEWQELADYLGGINAAGGKMKEVGTTHWITPNAGATNESGFNALPAGMHDFSGIFQWIGDHCAFASSTTIPSEYAVTSIMLQNSSAKMTIGTFHPDDAVSVRCVKN